MATLSPIPDTSNPNVTSIPVAAIPVPALAPASEGVSASTRSSKKSKKKIAKNRLKETLQRLTTSVESATLDDFKITLKAASELMGGKITDQGGQFNRTLLMNACRTMKTAIIKELLSPTSLVIVDPTAKDNQGECALTHLLCALSSDQEEIEETIVEIIGILLSYYSTQAVGAKNVNTANHQGTTFLMLAAQLNDLQIVEKLMNAGSDANVCDKKGYNAFMIAAVHGHLKILQRLQKNTVDIGKKDDLGHNVLALAILNGNSTIIDYLIEQPFSTDLIQAVDNSARNLVELLVSSTTRSRSLRKEERKALIIRLMKAGVELSTEGYGILKKMWKTKGDIIEIESLYQKQQAALGNATFATQTDPSDPSIEGANAEAEGGARTGSDPQLASDVSNDEDHVSLEEGLEEIEASGAERNDSELKSTREEASNPSDETITPAPMSATSSDSATSDKVCLGTLPKKRGPGRPRKSPSITKAASSKAGHALRKVSVLEKTVKASASKEPEYSLHNTAGVTIKAFKSTIVQLLNHGNTVDINIRDDRFNNRTPLMTAVVNEVLQNVEFLAIQKFGSGNNKSRDEKNKDKLFPLLEKVNINAQECYGNTALHLAVLSACEAAKSSASSSAACERSGTYIKMINVLLQNKTLDKNIRNNDGETALDIANRYPDHPSIAALLTGGKENKERDEVSRTTVKPEKKSPATETPRAPSGPETTKTVPTQMSESAGAGAGSGSSISRRAEFINVDEDSVERGLSVTSVPSPAPSTNCAHRHAKLLVGGRR